MSFTICHFNDAYLPKLAPFWQSIVEEKYPDALITCGGDVFNPSLMSTVTRGKHVPPLLNAMGVAVTVIGNHELDFGVPVYTKLAGQCKFPWLCSNLKIEGTVDSVVLEKNGVRVGFFGVVGSDFVGCLNLDTHGMVAEDVVACSRRMVAELEGRCDTIVALTHCRMADDKRIAEVCGGKFNLVLGAHDHEVMSQPPTIFKGGCDWNFIVAAHFRDGAWKVETVPVNTQECLPTQRVVDVLATWEAEMQAGLGKVLGTLAQPLDCHTKLIRHAESAVGNWVCDLVKNQFQVMLDRPVDAVLINCGSYRGDTILSGDFTVEKLLGLLPFNDLTLAYSISGAKLIEALEAGCSKWPAENGGFPSICYGMRVQIKNKKMALCQINDRDVDPLREYVLVTKTFLADGKDGYDCLAGHCTPLMDPEFAVLLSTMVRRALVSANTLIKLGARKPLSNRFIDKLRHKNSDVYEIKAQVDGRLIVE